MSAPITFDNSYRQLPERFYQSIDPTPVQAPELIAVNEGLAAQLGIDATWLESVDGVAVVAGNAIPEGSEPIASVYAGHQFGNWNPRLGDGRAVLLGEVIDAQGHRFDLQLKGSGPTLFSRGGDGRAPLGPVLREYLISEAMHALGVPSSRTLAAVSTGESVYREEALPGAVLLRVASSHIRFGTFQYFTSIGDIDAVRTLADHVIQRHYPDAKTAEQPYLELFQRVIDKTASLIAKWQALGFIHGVMNTDNMLVCGETIDYGPCAFMDTYHPETVFSSIDVGGRYAYQNQPGIGHWNLAALAQCIAPLLGDSDEATEQVKSVLDTYPERFYHYHRTAMANKLGLAEATDASDDLVKTLLAEMTDHKLDFTDTFTGLRLSLKDQNHIPNGLETWVQSWQQQISATDAAATIMQQANPVIIPRNHQVEAAITAGLEQDLEPFHQLNHAFSNPFSDQWLETDLAQAPQDTEVVYKTFCGT